MYIYLEKPTSLGTDLNRANKIGMFDSGICIKVGVGIPDYDDLKILIL
jgi:hypothetical protein